MKKFGLLGASLKHSKSPVIHQKISAYFKLDHTYDLYETTKENLNEMINQIRVGKIDGFNVTIPYKETVIPYLDELTPRARKVGAVNTIYKNGNLVIGDNTDYAGFQLMLQRTRIDLKGKRILILGTGGAAKACYHTFKDLGIIPTVVSRSKTRDPNFEKVITYQMIEPMTYDIIVNATPIGMYPQIDQSPLNETLVKDKIVIDLIYNPSQTKLMSYAKRAFNGFEMLMLQALKAEEIWYQTSFHLTDELMELIKRSLL